MIKQDQLKVIADVLRVDADSISKAITSQEEVELTIPAIKSYTDDELAEFKKNVIEAAKPEIWKAASEITIKNIKKDAGLEFEGKDHNILIEKFREKILTDAKIEPDKKLSEKEQLINELRNKIEEIDGSYKKQLTEKEQAINDIKITGVINSHIPDELSDGWTKSDLAVLFRNSHDVFEENGRLYVKKNGQVVSDNKTLRPIELSDVVRSFVTDKGVIKASKGRGGANDYGKPDLTIASIKNYDDFFDYCKKNNIKTNSIEATKLLGEVIAANPEFKKQ